MDIEHRIGDVLEAAETQAGYAPVIIPHVCNDLGVWGAGFVVSLSNRWWQPEAMYRNWRLKDYETFKRGEIQPVYVKHNIWVVNMIAQVMGDPKMNLRYDALAKCLEQLDNFIADFPSSPIVYAPRFGAGLAGGDWAAIEGLIQALLHDPVYIYTLESEAAKWPMKSGV